MACFLFFVDRLIDQIDQGTGTFSTASSQNVHNFPDLVRWKEEDKLQYDF